MMDRRPSADHPRMRLRLALLTLLAAVGLVAAGCGGTAGPERTLLSLSSSAKQTSAAETYRMEMRMSMTMPGVKDPLELTADGAVDTAARRTRMSMDMSKMLGPLGAAGGQALPDASQLKVDMVMDGLTVYMRMPLLTGQLPAGKSWVSIDAAALAQAGGANLTSLLGNGYGDPSQYLDYLTTAGDLQELGDEEVRGVDTRHVRANIDLERYVAQLDPATRKAMGPLVDQFEQMVGSTRPVVEAWVGDDGLVRRIAFAMDLSVPASSGAAGGDVSMTMTMDLYDFGADVAVDVPSAAEVVDGTSLGLGG